jgi:hypothetical protein
MGVYFSFRGDFDFQCSDSGKHSMTEMETRCGEEADEHQPSDDKSRTVDTDGARGWIVGFIE